MSDTKERLIRSFKVIFPDLTETQIIGATQSSVNSWDSIATVTLVNVIEEEFGLEIAVADVAHLLSFPLLLDYLKTR